MAPIKEAHWHLFGSHIGTYLGVTLAPIWESHWHLLRSHIGTYLNLFRKGNLLYLHVLGFY